MIKMPTLKTMAVLALAVVAATGCSRMRHGGGPGENGGAYANGLGAQGGIHGYEDLVNANCNSAPAEQVYHFDYDSSHILSIDQPCIEAQANFLKNHREAHVWLYGNTDERGSREYNIGLGERRGKSVADMLEVNGVKRSQVTVISYGQEKPVEIGHDESAFRKNRRVELHYKGRHE